MLKIEKEILLLRLKNIDINLQEIGINFYPNEFQIQVLNDLIDFFNGEGFGVYNLEGYAGTGKSSIVKILLTYFEKVDPYKIFTISAPTHRAKGVIEGMTGKEGQTIHSLLGLFPDLDLEEIDVDNLSFDKKNPDGILNYKGSLIIDECSIINDFLDDLIQRKAREQHVRVLYIGDSAQIKPVKQTTISKTFLTENKSQLTAVQRIDDDNPIHWILANLRLPEPEYVDYIKSSKIIQKVDENGNIHHFGATFVGDTVSFVEHIKRQFLDKEFINNKLFTRIICFTNQKVGVYNNIVRTNLGFQGPWKIGELLMAYDNYQIKNPLKKIVNGCDYTILECEKEERFIAGRRLQGYYIKLQGVQTKNKPSVFLLDSSTPSEIRDELGQELEELRQFAVATGKTSDWIPYMELKNSFCSTFDLFYEGRKVKKRLIDYGYAVTTHKAQGGTFKNILVDMKNMDICADPQLRQQLKYVGLSRMTNVAIGFV